MTPILKKSNNRKKTTLIIICSLAVLIVLFFYNRQLIVAHYYNSKHNHFSKGDKGYAYKYFVSDVSTAKLPLMRLIKSTTSSEFRLISSGKTIIDDSLEKYKSSYIGTYIDYKFLPYMWKNKENMRCIYAINPNWKAINRNDSIPETLPKNFVFADSSFYLNWAIMVDKELNKFN